MQTGAIPGGLAAFARTAACLRLALPRAVRLLKRPCGQPRCCTRPLIFFMRDVLWRRGCSRCGNAKCCAADCSIQSEPQATRRNDSRHVVRYAAVAAQHCMLPQHVVAGIRWRGSPRAWSHSYQQLPSNSDQPRNTQDHPLRPREHGLVAA